MTVRRQRLRPGDAEAIEEIRAGLERYPDRCLPGDDDIIHIALRLMQRDLNSACGGEVVEDARWEIGYRQWCAQTILYDAR